MPGRSVSSVTAPLVTSWNKWRSGSFVAPPLSPLGGEIPGSRKVELFIGEQWVDITRLDANTPGVYYRDDIVITRGKSDEAATLDPSTCRFTLNNRDGRFSPRNPMSPYYGKIGRNTPVRVSVVQANGVRRYRFYGEVSSWPQKWDISGTDVYVQVEASGILRRLGQGTNPLGSAMYRGCTLGLSRLAAYWPCEDVTGSTQIASALTGVTAMSISGTPTIASDSTSFASSQALPVMGSASFTGYVPSYDTSLDQAQVRFLLSVPSAGATNGQIICSVYTSGNIPRWELYYGTGGSLGLRGFDATDTNVADTSSVAFAINGSPVRVSIEFARSGGSLSFKVATLAPNASTGFIFGGSVTATLGKITRVVMATNKGLSTTSIGHITVQGVVTGLFDLGSQVGAWLGEHAGLRIARLCAEEGINFYRWQPQGDTTPMGNQLTDTLVDLIRACADADLGRLSEPRDTLGFGYRDRVSLYDQAAVLTLDYSAGQLSDSLTPVDDDQHTCNDLTLTRDGGSSARATEISGPLSVNTIGRYESSATVKVQTDSQLLDLATWRLHLGTTDEARYPQVGLNLLHPTFTASDSMTTAALVLDIGDRVRITNLPPWLPPNGASLIVEGYTETIGGNGQHTITLNCSPESPYHIPIYNDPTYRYSSDGSSLAADVDAVSVSLSVSTPSGPLWSANDGSFGISVGGERMTVTAISGTTSPQTFTVTRSVNGVVKTHSAGDDVSLFASGFYAI